MLASIKSIFGASRAQTLIVTGADADHFANLRVLIGSWWSHLRERPLAVCDFGLSAAQREELGRIPGLVVLPPPMPIAHPWQGKSLIGRFIASVRAPWEILMWIDADALFASPLPPLADLIEGYDMILDAHVQSVGEIVHDCNLTALGLRKDDAYFSAGCWIARRGCLLETYERLTKEVQGDGNLWECDAFVAAIYREKLRIRTVNGGIWHARGKTSLHTCEVRGLQAFHAGQPIYVLHANDGYTVRADGRRVFKRPELAAIQDHYERVYQDALAAQPVV
jgi:hypothetical protein